MNNDISSDYKYVNVSRRNSTAKIPESKSDKESAGMSDKETNFNDSMTFLGNMGYVKVNMDKVNLNKNILKSVEEYINNPEYAKMHTDFCDGLVESGYSLEDAIDYTDEVFDVLSSEKTYIEAK